jgi:hypothetical protein
MRYIEWFLPYAIPFEIILIAAVLAVSLAPKAHVVIKRHKALRRAKAIAAATAVIVGVTIGGAGLLDQYQVSYIGDPVAAMWTNKVATLRREFGGEIFTSDSCSHPLIRAGDPASDAILELSYSIHCETDKRFVLNAIEHGDQFTRYGAVQSWVRARSAYNRSGLNVSYDQDLEVVRAIGSSISSGDFPSAMRYDVEGGLATAFRQYIRENSLIWKSFWTIEDKSLSIQIVFKEFAEIGSAIWFRILNKPPTFHPDTGGPIF